MSPDPNEIKQLITEYKSQTENESAIINAMNESILISYKDAVMNNCIENDKHIKLFELFYKIHLNLFCLVLLLALFSDFPHMLAVYLTLINLVLAFSLI